MKRKYYLRGLGIGILVTALVFIFAGPSELSEEDIIKRAEELGYTKAEVSPSIGIKDLLETPAPTIQAEKTGTPTPTMLPEKTPVPTQVITETPVPTEVLESTPVPTSTPTPEPEGTAAPEPTPTVTPVPTPTVPPTPTSEPTPGIEVTTAVISVERGNSATVVCNKIEAAGILEDGEKLRTYLIEHDLTDYINIGNYTLSSDMSIEQIAGIIAKK